MLFLIESINKLELEHFFNCQIIFETRNIIVVMIVEINFIKNNSIIITRCLLLFLLNECNIYSNLNAHMVEILIVTRFHLSYFFSIVCACVCFLFLK